MRKLVIAIALASTGLAAPALARDNSFYAGLEGGGMLIEDSPITYNDAFAGTVNRAYVLEHKPGWDVDLIAGYDFGMIRLEGELGYKRASIDQVEVNNAITRNLFGPGSQFDATGHSSAWSAMINGLLDFGDEDSWSGYVGAGIGAARVHEGFDIDLVNRNFNGSTGRIAWQAVAGVRKAITPNLDIGLKYRFFNVPNMKGDFEGDTVRTRWRSHSLLLSLIYNFAPPPPPPPPAPERG